MAHALEREGAPSLRFRQGWGRCVHGVIGRVFDTSGLQRGEQNVTIDRPPRHHMRQICFNHRMRTPGKSRFSCGFSLLEMTIVLTLLLLLAALEVPNIQGTIRKTQEARLRDDLFTMRAMIDRFTADNKRPPTSLDELVETGYLGDVPADPITKSNETWVLDTENYSVTDTKIIEGIVDVHSGSDGISPEGTPYSSW